MEKLQSLPTQEELNSKYKDHVIYLAKPDENVIVANDGSWMPKSKLDEKQEEIKTLKESIQSTSAELTKLKNEAKDLDTVKATITKLEGEKAEMEKRLTLVTKTAALRESYIGIGVDPEFVDFVIGKEHPDINAVTLNEKGKFVLAEDKIKSIKENKSYAKVIGKIVIEGSDPHKGDPDKDKPKTFMDEFKDAFH
jgi:hypothetical protein